MFVILKYLEPMPSALAYGGETDGPQASYRRRPSAHPDQGVFRAERSTTVARACGGFSSGIAGKT